MNSMVPYKWNIATCEANVYNHYCTVSNIIHSVVSKNGVMNNNMVPYKWNILTCEANVHTTIITPL